MIRKAAAEDLPCILPIYDYARSFMVKNGNPTQWQHSPTTETLKNDIRLGNLYVVENNGHIIGVFALIFGEDPTYRVIEGSWLDESPYGTIHRVASAEGAHGVFAAALAFALEKSNHLRIDTHRDNLQMQHLILKHGFQYCGVIHVADGSPRLAYERVEEK